MAPGQPLAPRSRHEHHRGVPTDSDSLAPTATSAGPAAWALALLLAACSGEKAKDVAVDYRVASRTVEHGEDLDTVIRDATGFAVVVTATDEMAAAVAAGLAATDPAPMVVGIGGLPDAGRLWVSEGRISASVQRPTCASEAVDMALLLCNGVVLPAEQRRLQLGPRTWTRETLAEGGVATPTPGDILLSMLRQQHSDILTTTPQTDEVFRIGLLSPEAPDSWQNAVAEQTRNAIGRYPQLHAETHTRLDAALASQPNLLILIDPDRSHDQPALERAVEEGLKVLAIGGDKSPVACTQELRADEAAIGTAVARLIRDRHAAGCSVLTIATTAAGEELWRALRAELERPRLR